MHCLVCHSPEVHGFTARRKPLWGYFHCLNCDVIYMDPAGRLKPEDEKVRYDMHENENSEGYRKFFEPLIAEVDRFAKTQATPIEDLQILDYGCGPTAFLSKLLAEKSYRVINYDIFYYTNQSPLQKMYDVILSTEVWEHFYHPLEEIEQLTKLMKPDGIMAIMTSAHKGLEDFEGWHYRRDPTHVVFYSEKTMQWLAKRFALKLAKSDSPYWIFQRQKA